MVFVAESFIYLFLPLFLLAYVLAPAGWRNFTILAASWVFYAWWRLDFLPLIVSIAVWSWLTGLWIGRAQGRARRWALLAGITWPLLSMLWFKYANLLVDTLGWMGAPVGGWQAVLLPIGLSFFVFGAISYSVDVYRGTVSPEPSFINYATYQSMFGHLVAGPVVRYEWVAERLRQRAFDPAEFAVGAQRFMLGFAQKVLVADTLAPLVEAGYQLAAPTSADVALTVLAFTLQLYFDFAAYSSMAIGLGLMVGLKFVENFNAPYLSTSLAEFWRRWHISLSSWLRDYLYIPLGGNRCAVWRASLNLMITMGLGGLWHGASWTFLLWGLWHGGGLAAGRVWHALKLPRVPALAGHVLTLLFVMLGWLLFRAQSGGEALLMTAGLLGWHGWGMSGAFAAAMRPNQIVMLLIGVALVYLPLRVPERLPRLSLWLAAPLWVLALWVLHGRSVVPFLYFQF